MIVSKASVIALKKPPITPDNLTIVFIDFETYFSSADGYTLKKMSVTEYVNDPRFSTIGFSIKVGSEAPRWVWGDQAAEVLGAIDWDNAAVVAHNAKFDGAILAWRYGINPRLWIDTVGMAKAVFGPSMASFSLSSLADRLGLPKKGFLATDGKLTLQEDEKKALVVYGMLDLDILIKAYEKLKPDFPASQWTIMDWTVRCFTEPILELDLALTEKIIADIQAEKEEMIRSIGLEQITLSSNKKFAEYLKSLGYTVPTKVNKKGTLIPALAVQDVAFQEMLNSDDMRLRAICEARVGVKQTMEIKRAEKLNALGARTKRYPFDVGFSGAIQTHRFSGGNAAGGNPQNFPKTDKSDLRYAITVPEGYTLLVADFKNIEWRILSFIARDARLMKMIRENIDPYCDFASRVYGRTITKADKAERAFGKEAVLGLGYGMGWETFKNRVKLKLGQEISEDQARDTVKLYRNTYLAVLAFWGLCGELLGAIAEGRAGLFPTFPQIRIAKHALVLPSGLSLRFPNLRQVEIDKSGEYEWVFDKYKSSKKETESVRVYGAKLTENICQALAGEVCKEAIERLRAEGFPPAGQVHDELLVPCRIEDLEKAKAAVFRAMTNPMPWWPELVLETDVGAGKSWGHAK